ncbi:MAG: SRPBCC domain-containing protein [Thaumarchaeota archaeon]|nr:SRPBCC domain-containing protein [Nitrososphaerota archaeon]
MELDVTITLKEVDSNKTKMILNYPTVGDIDEMILKNMNHGWCQSLDKLAETLK